jgi:uncharacterized RDD family membrane protein YckC
MSLTNRCIVAAVLWAIFILVTSILDAFVQLPWLNEWLFHSTVFPIALTVAFLIAAPYFVQVFGLRFSRSTSGNDDA